MAFSTKVDSFAQPGSTGNQSVTGVGFQPKAILFFLNSRTSDGTSNDAVIGLGMATSSTSRASIAHQSLNGNLGSDTDRSQDNTKCIHLINSSAATLCAADLVTMDADGFTINWTTVDANARIINFIAFGGTDLTNVTIKEFNIASATGNQATTGVGFKPDCIFLISSAINAASPTTTTFLLPSIGVGINNSNRFAITSSSQPGVNPSVTAISQVTNKVFKVINNTSINAEGDLVSMDADGFTINWTTALGTIRPIFALCLKGGSYATGTIIQPSGTGNQVITGLKFSPKGLILASFNSIPTTSSVEANKFSFGAASGISNRGSIWFGDRDNVTTTVSQHKLDRTKIIQLVSEGTPTINADADLASFDYNGFTLNWTTADATAREVAYLAIGDTPTFTFNNYQFVKVGDGMSVGGDKIR